MRFHFAGRVQQEKGETAQLVTNLQRICTELRQMVGKSSWSKDAPRPGLNISSFLLRAGHWRMLV
eukprot:38030-Eustigmatos_ZCMA.PRE.1